MLFYAITVDVCNEFRDKGRVLGLFGRRYRVFPKPLEHPIRDLKYVQLIPLTRVKLSLQESPLTEAPEPNQLIRPER